MKLRLRVGEVMDKKGKTVYRVAKDSGISINTVRALKQGENRRIDFEIIEKIAQVLDVEPIELLDQSECEPGQRKAA